MARRSPPTVRGYSRVAIEDSSTQDPADSAGLRRSVAIMTPLPAFTCHASSHPSIAAPVRSCSRTAADVRSVPRTRARPSTSASRPAPTGSSSTCTCRATGCRSSTTTPTSTGAPTPPDRSPPARPTSSDASTRPAASARSSGSRGAAGAWACPRSARCWPGIPDVPVIVEIKAGTEATARAVVETVTARGRGRPCLRRILQHGRAAARCGALEPRLATSAGREESQLALYRTWLGLGLGRVGYQAFQVPERAGRLRVVSERLIRSAHASGLAFQVWTVNERPDMWRLLDWGVDALISDRPDVAVDMRDEWVRRSGGGETPTPNATQTPNAERHRRAAA